MQTCSELKKAVLDIFHAGLKAVDPHDAVRRHLRLRDQKIIVTSGDERGSFAIGPESDFNKVLIVGAGKASARMCQAVEEVLGNRICGGLVVTKTDHSVPTRYVEVVEASHPVPDERGLQAAQRVIELVRAATADTLVMVLISGGGSALLPLPAEGITLAEKQEVTNLLLRVGAEIREINAVRKHLSAIKGGWLAAHAAPASTLSFILSDVIGDRLDVIASGPTVPDGSTFADALEVLDRRGILESVPVSVRQRFEMGSQHSVEETPKADAKFFKKVRNVLVGTNRAALRACCRAAEAKGWKPLLISSMIKGETREIARMHAAIALEVRKSAAPVAPPACIISGGETTVTYESCGKGGRNQEFALAAALEIVNEPGMAVLSGGTDGTDGPTDAAGAIAFGDTVARAAASGHDAFEHLAKHDAYPFFDAIGDLIRIGPTHTNVMDIHLLLVDE